MPSRPTIQVSDWSSGAGMVPAQAQLVTVLSVAMTVPPTSTCAPMSLKTPSIASVSPTAATLPVTALCESQSTVCTASWVVEVPELPQERSPSPRTTASASTAIETAEAHMRWFMAILYDLSSEVIASPSRRYLVASIANAERNVASTSDGVGALIPSLKLPAGSGRSCCGSVEPNTMFDWKRGEMISAELF